MKKFITIVALIALVFSMAFANENQQKIYRTDSEVYEAITFLYLNQGHALPSTTGPWSAAELTLMLNKIDPSNLTEGMKAAYDFAKAELTKEPKTLKDKEISFNFNINVNLEGYYHTNSADKAFNGSENLVYGTQQQKPFFGFSWETFAAKNFYALFNFNLMNSPRFTERYAVPLSTNIVVFRDLKLNLDDLDFNFPFRAFASVGSNNWNIELGRDRLSWGAGKTGNMAISDNLPYHNMAKFTTFSENYKYTFLTSFFPHPVNYYDENGYVGRGSQADATKGLSFYMAHRVEGRFFSDRLGLTLTEAIMYMAEDGTIDPKVFNPIGLFHNYYIRANANSTLILELDFNIVKGVNIFAQAICDEFALPGEPTEKTTPYAFPQAFGLMFGAKSAFSLGNGILYASAEGVKTDPFLYLRYKDEINGKQKDKSYGINYVVAFRSFSMDKDITYQDYFLGYRHGGDAIVANLNVGYKQLGKFSVETNVFYMLHGTFDKWSCWRRIGDGSREDVPKWDQFVAPTSTHNTYNNKDNADAQTRDAVSKTLVAGVNFKYQFNKHFDAFVQADFVSISNAGNHSGVNKSDIQIAFGASYNL